MINTYVFWPYFDNRGSSGRLSQPIISTSAGGTCVSLPGVIYLESQFLRDPTDNTKRIVIRKENGIFAGYHLHTKFSTLKVRSSLNLRNGCKPAGL